MRRLWGWLTKGRPVIIDTTQPWSRHGLYTQPLDFDVVRDPQPGGPAAK